MNPFRLRRAFTLVELLVAIAIIGMLVSLLLPAVQAARESARRTQCTNNLKQQGIALQSYHDTFRVFPASYYSDTRSPTADPETLDGPGGWAWGTMLLPHLDRSDLYDRLRFDRSCWDSENSELVKTKLAVFLCPSSTNTDASVQVQNQSRALLATFGRSTYVASTGKEEPWGFLEHDYQSIADGPMFRNAKISSANVTDGLSTTVFLGEHSADLSNKTWVGVVPGAIVCTNNTVRFPMTGCDYGATLVNVHSGPAAGEVDPISGLAPIHPPNSPLCHVCQMFSEHRGGANVVMGDGSVRFISSNIKHLVWAALSSRAHGEAISSNDF